MIRPAPPDRFDRRLLPPMMLGAILNPVNSSIIAVALVPIAAAFGAPAAETAWLVSSLYVATAVGQPLVGRLVDVFGPRTLFLAGTALTGAAGLIGVLAPSIAVLVVARVVLGLGTCAGYPSAMVLIRREGARTGRDSPAGVLTALSITTQTVAAVGPTLGGLLIDLGGWRATFAIDVPLAVAGLVLGALVLPRDEAGPHPLRRLLALDWAGVGLFVATLVALLVLLMAPGPATVWLALVVPLTGAAFAVRERRAGDPFIDVRVLAGNGPLVRTYARALLAQTVSYAFLYGFTQWLGDGRGLSPTVSGLVLLPVFGVGLVVAALTGRRPEVRGKLLIGALVQAAVCAVLLVVVPGTPVWALLALSALLGLPQGLVNLANQNALYRQADEASTGTAAGLLRTFQYLGAILAASASALLFGRRADTAGLHDLALVMVGASVLLVVLVLADRSLRDVARREAAGGGRPDPR